MYYVVKYTVSNRFVCIVSGLGRNAGTWDSAHGQRTAQRHAAALRKRDASHLYRVEAL